jgi:hypothetical protein
MIRAAKFLVSVVLLSAVVAPAQTNGGRTRITAAMRWKAEHPESASAEEMNRPIFEKK